MIYYVYYVRAYLGLLYCMKKKGLNHLEDPKEEEEEEERIAKELCFYFMS